MINTGTLLYYLEYRQTAENADKFHAVVRLDGGVLMLRYGRIGTVGQTRAASDDWFTKRKEKLREGYTERMELQGQQFTYEEGYGSETWQAAVDRLVAGASGVANPLDTFQAEVLMAMRNARSDPDQAFVTFGLLSQQMVEIKSSYDTCAGYLDTLRDVITAHSRAS
jgi:predicted DNA-binding WGR domain protein